MQTPSGRFSTAAREAGETSPPGVSRREGWFGVSLATLQAFCLAVVFQAQNMVWGGLILAGTLGLNLLGILAMTTMSARVRGVHPRGHRRALGRAGGWAVVVTAVGGWLWIAQGPHDSSAATTTAVAVVAYIPFLLAAARFVRAAS